jgi:hypothetical protein
MALLRSFVLILGSALLLAACARSPVVQLYDGAQKPDAQVLTVRVPSDLEVFTINGQEIDGVNTFFSSGYKDLKLTPGRYEIVAFYKRLWDLDPDNHEVMKSDPAKFMVDGQGGEFYRLGFERPENAEEARELADDFSGWVENMQTGEKTPSEDSGLVLNRGLLSPITGTDVESAASASVVPQGGGGTDQPVRPRARKATTVAPESEQPEASAPAPAAAPAPAGQSAQGASYLDTLKAQWNQATPEERRQFLQWLSQ